MQHIRIHASILKTGIELLNLNECICNRCLAEPKYSAIFDTNAGEFLGEEVIDQTNHYYALRPFSNCIYTIL